MAIHNGFPCGASEEIALPLTSFLVRSMRLTHRFHFRDFRYRDIPPRFIAWYAALSVNFHHNHRGTGIRARRYQGGLQILAGPCATCNSPEAGRIGSEIHGQDIASQFAIHALAIVRSEATASHGLAQPVDAREAVVVNHDDVQLD